MDFEKLKVNLKLMVGGVVEMRACFESICQLVLVNARRTSVRTDFFQSWRESQMVSQSQQSPTTVQAAKDEKFRTNLVYLIEAKDAGVYLTINFQRSTQKWAQSKAQVLASATTFLDSWHKTNSISSAPIPEFIKHYGLMFVGENDWAIFETIPKRDSQGRWLGWTSRQISQGGYDKYEDYCRLVRRINEIHWWGLEEFAEGILKSVAVVDSSITKSSQVDASASSSSDAGRSGTSATRRTTSTQGTSAIEETDTAVQERPQSVIHTPTTLGQKSFVHGAPSSSTDSPTPRTPPQNYPNPARFTSEAVPSPEIHKSSPRRIIERFKSAWGSPKTIIAPRTPGTTPPGTAPHPIRSASTAATSREIGQSRSLHWGNFRLAKGSPKSIIARRTPKKDRAGMDPGEN